MVPHDNIFALHDNTVFAPHHNAGLTGQHLLSHDDKIFHMITFPPTRTQISHDISFQMITFAPNELC